MKTEELSEALFAEEPTINGIKLKPFDFAAQSLLIKTSFYYEDEDLRSRGISVTKSELFILSAPSRDVASAVSQKPEKYKQAVESYFLEGGFTHAHIQEFLEWRNKVSAMNEATNIDVEDSGESDGEPESPN